MTIPGIWTKGDDDWMLSRPKGFPDEATLHRLIADRPDMLPLAGAPRLVILGSEVGLGAGSADLLGVETSGRPVIIEVKLARNNEARRAVVAQILAYAAYLHGMTREQLEDRLRGSLQKAGHATIPDAVMKTEQGAVDHEEFTAALDVDLREGRFRLVFVLDDVPQELMTLVAYLEHVTDKLVIDLVAVSNFDVNGTPVMIPQRVTPERQEVTVEQANTGGRGSSTVRYHGVDQFEALFEDAPVENRKTIKSVLDWTRDIEQEGLATLETAIGPRNKTVRAIVPGENAGFVALWQSRNGDGIDMSIHDSVLKRRVPQHLVSKVSSLSPKGDGGIPFTHINDKTLAVLTEAYKEAAKYPGDEGS